MLTGEQPALDWRGLMEMVPRLPFVAEVFREESAKDAAIPIGHGVHASKPSTIARMLDLLCAGREPHKRQRVLEIGTGCGWQTALLTKLFCEVYSIEYVLGLHERAGRDLRDYRVCLKHGDGFAGWPEQAPFDGIIASCAIPALPDLLVKQLAPGGVLVAPVGDASTQRLVRVVMARDEPIYEDCGPAGFTVSLR